MALRTVPTLQYVHDNTMMLARHSSGYRFVGCGKEFDDHCKLYDTERDYECGYDIKDTDVVCAQGQPEDLQWFYTKYESYCKKYGFTTIPEFHAELMKFAKYQ